MVAELVCVWAGGWEGDPCLCASVAWLARISVRQAAVLELVAVYRSNAEIAAELGVAVKTAKRHVENLRQLTGCRSKGQLGQWWRAHEARWRTALGRPATGWAEAGRDGGGARQAAGRRRGEGAGGAGRN